MVSFWFDILAFALAHYVAWALIYLAQGILLRTDRKRIFPAQREPAMIRARAQHLPIVELSTRYPIAF